MVFITPVKLFYRLWPVAVWLIAWHGLSAYIGQEVLLVSPVAVAAKFIQLIQEAAFWQSVLFSFQRIAAGFLLAVEISRLFAPVRGFFFILFRSIRLIG